MLNRASLPVIHLPKPNTPRATVAAPAPPGLGRPGGQRERPWQLKTNSKQRHPRQIIDLWLLVRGYTPLYIPSYASRIRLLYGMTVLRGLGTSDWWFEWHRVFQTQCKLKLSLVEPWDWSDWCCFVLCSLFFGWTAALAALVQGVPRGGLWARHS